MKRILVVEDESKIARLVRDYLEHAGFEVVVASDGRWRWPRPVGPGPTWSSSTWGCPGGTGWTWPAACAGPPTCRS